VSDIDNARLERELKHYKAQLAGKWGRFRTLLRNVERLKEVGSRNPWWQEWEMIRLAETMGTIGLKYLALKERMKP